VWATNLPEDIYRSITTQEVTTMATTYRTALCNLWLNVRGQDIIEYALMAASIAVLVAGFLPPALMPMVSTIFSKVASEFTAAGSVTGS
jgi:Flp pilus assembly pilin Flp